MALKLTVEQAEAYCMTDAEARRAGEEGRARRARTRRVTEEGAQVSVPAGNQVLRLCQAGLLRLEHVRAASDIAEHYHAVTRALHPRCGLAAERLPRSPDADASPAEARRTRRYMDWATWADAQAATPAISYVTLTLDLAVDGLTLEQIRIRRCMSHRRVLRLIQISLWQYALLAGWCDDRAAKAA